MSTDGDLERAAELLRAGELVVLPTETVYGLAANALNPQAVERIYRMKGRPATSPLIVHVSSIEMARSLARQWPGEAEILAKKYWPGPLTMVLPKHASIPSNVTAGLDTVGLRMPRHPLTLEVIRRAELPVAAPSANRFTELSPTTAAHARDALGSDTPFLVDGGPCEVGIESVVLSLAGGQPVLLRPGMITKQELEDVLGCAVETASRIEGAHPSPGMHEKHYSPRTRVLLVKEEMPKQGRGVFLALHSEAAAGHVIRMPHTPGAYAQRLYSALREADARHADWIAIELPPADSPWQGILDRLRRAGMGVITH